MDELTEVFEALNLIKGGSSIGSSKHDGIAYQPLPDFLNTTTLSQKELTVKETYKIVEDKIRPGSSVVDIGANIGYFSFMLQENKHCRCSIIEKDQQNLVVIERLNKVLQNRGMTPVKLITDLGSGDWDYALLLNVHHWIEHELGREGAIGYMHNLAERARVMFFQTAHSESRSLYKVDYLKNVSDIQLYLELCGWRYSVCLGSTQPEEPRYLFYCHN